MIKLITFADRPDGSDLEAFTVAWRSEVARRAGGTDSVRPHRSVLCRALPDETPDPRHDVFIVESFTDLEHAERFRGSVPQPAVELGVAGTFLADEDVRRGEDWLARRWEQGGKKAKHMAVACRAAGLTPAEFSSLWRARAGMVGRPGTSGAVVIPEPARGLAYAQNHLVDQTVEAPYDAVNEVWFDDREGLRVRIEWFAEHMTAGAEDDLVGDHWFVAVEEEPVVP